MSEIVAKDNATAAVAEPLGPDTETGNTRTALNPSPTDDDGAVGNSAGGAFGMAPGKFGTYASYFLLIAGMVASIITQRYASDISITDFTSNCPSGFDDSCRANGAVLRFSFALTVIYFIQLIGTTVTAIFFDKFWAIKFIIFIGVVIGFFYANPDVFDTNGYAWFARIAGFFFILLQQIILLDFAFTWNESWVQNSEEEGEQDGKKWLVGLISVSVILFATSISAIGVMFWQFSGPQCGASNTIISLTLILSIGATVFQIFMNEEYSLLASATMTLYATYVCYSAVTLNPDESCNPTLSTDFQTLSSAIGMAITVISVTWATYTAVTKVSEANAASSSSESGYYAPGLRAVLQEATIVFILASSYYCMVLTNWATLQSSFSLSDPKTGDASMWIQASAQWAALLLYIWALVAPKLFPDRDFGGN